MLLTFNASCLIFHGHLTGPTTGGSQNVDTSQQGCQIYPQLGGTSS